MSKPAVSIPEKLFFKIGEVCEIVGVQAHVLRYWETEFPMLAPQKNRAGQRTYRKRDVEIALRVRELLYEDQYTIAGAKKKLAAELRSGNKFRLVPQGSQQESLPLSQASIAEVQAHYESLTGRKTPPLTDDTRAALRDLASQLRELLSMIESNEVETRK